jgi:hypothetical protein
MRDELYGLKLIQKYAPTAAPQPTDLVSAEFCVIGFRSTYSQMTAEERNSMRERHWFRDPSVDAWVYNPPEREFFPISKEISRNNEQSEPISSEVVVSGQEFS